MTYRVVVVCSGNICRSPIAEAVLRGAFDEAGLVVDVSSAGTGGWHAGDPADPRAMRVLEAHGYELVHSARQFDPRWFDDVDLVLALDAENLADLRRLAQRHGLAHAHVRALRSFDPAVSDLPEMSAELDVPDPYYGDDEGFEVVLQIIEAAAPGVVDYARIDGF
ncbi:MAG: low molecular weight phosphotyrosine protein phosphatase [Actinobacteria bacterium]|nr:low molecular weight phosphotyrosine protein phosphatase [Actinomycetota bacterium]